MIERIRTREDALRANARLLEDYQERLRSMAAELVVAEERERRVLAEALHDSVCQTLTVAKLQLDCLLKRERADEDEVARLTHSRNLVEQAVVEARGLIGQMSPPVLYDVGLDAAIDHLADQIEDRFGLKIRVQTDDGDGEGIPLSDDLRVLLYRAVQELLMNVVKHAGATQAEVKLRRRDGRAEVSVSDNGSGFQRPSAETVPTAHGGFGLFSLRERVHHIGGELTVDSKPGAGACVRIAVPLRGPEPPRRAAPA
jgi:signal transduction histidine kinase